MVKPVRIGDMNVQMPVMLAPMAGVTNAPFRRMCREAAIRGYEKAGVHYDPSCASPINAPLGLYVCEMITSRALVQGSQKTFDMIRPDDDEFPKSVQLYGVAPAVMERAAFIAVSKGYADHIDLNFGCPVPKVTRKGGGSALPWKLSLFRDIVRGVVRGVRDGFAEYCAHHDHPAQRIGVTAKIRLGIDDEHETYRDAGLIAQDEGVDSVVLHGRTLEEHYSGTAHWEPIARLVEELSVPVFGNGDVFDRDDAIAMMEQTQCAGVVIGRGAQGRPWIFTDIVAAFLGVDYHSTPTLGEVCELIRRHARLLVQHDGDELHAMRDMRKHLGWYLRGFPVGGDTRQLLAGVRCIADIDNALSRLDPDTPYPQAGDGPRGRKGRPRPARLPDGWLDSREMDEGATRLLAHAEIDGLG